MTLPTDLAERLHAARRDDQCIPFTGVPANLDQAFDIQQAVYALNTSRTVGYKIGATVAAALDALKLQAPFHGLLQADHHMMSGSRFALPRSYPVSVESEFVVTIGEDLVLETDATPIDRISAEPIARIANAVASVAPGIELAGTRFDMPFARNGCALVADAASNVATVAGAPITDIADLDLATHEAVLTINGEEVARGLGGNSLAGHPYAMVAWLLSQPAFADRGIKAGEFVFCGTCTGVLPVKAGDVLEADFGVLGTVAVTLD